LTRKRIFSLRFKLGVAALVVEFLTVAVLTWQGVNLAQKHLAEEYASSIAELLPVLQSALVTPLLEEDIITIKEVLSPLTRAEEGGVQALRISNQNGDILWSVNSARLEESLSQEEHPHVEISPQHFLSHTLSANARTPFRIQLPLSLDREQVGSVELLFDTESLFTTLAALTRHGLVIGALAITLGSLVFVLLARAMTINLVKIERAADAVSRGEYQTSIDIHSRDELGTLATAFNRMARQIESDWQQQRDREQQMQRQHEQLTGAETVANIGSWSRDLKTQELHWSPGFYQVMEIDPNEPPSYEKLAARLPKEARKVATDALTGKSAAPMIFTITRPGGGHRDIEVTVRLFYDDQTTPRRIVGTIRDITQQLAAARASREGEQMLLSVINNAPALVVLKDREGHILHSNQTHAAVFGMQPDELIGRTSFDFHPQAEAEEIVARDEEVFRTGQRSEIIETLFNGVEKRIYNTTRTPLTDESGAVFALVFFAWDVTNQAQSEDQRRSQQKMEALGQLTGGVAHDYNNMLAIILGYAELLNDRLKDDPQSSTFVNEILHAGRRSAEMTKKLLGFAKQQPSTTNSTELNKVVENNLDVFKKSVAADVQITLELAEDLLPVRVSVAELEDALINLVVNARQAMPTGGNLIIRTENRSMSAGQMRDTRLPPGNYVTLTIIDTGTGMDQQTIDRVFEPFFTTKGKLGTGLGLSQVYGFLQRAGGDIQISSTPGKGSQFTLYFQPSADSDSAASLPVVDPSAALDTLPGTGQILLVDDEPALVEMSYEILTSRGYEVTMASSGEDALQAISDLADSRFDLLISDIIMPNMDGQRLAQLARQQQPGLKVLFVSGYNQATAIKLRPGYTDLLTKPFSSNELLNKTRQMIHGTPTEHQEPAATEEN